MKRAQLLVGWLMLLVVVPPAMAQVQVGDELRMTAGGTLSAGYSANYGNDIPSSHGLNFGANGALAGSYHDPNFLNFNIIPYYNQSRANSSFQSLVDSSGVDATVNLFSGSRFPGYASYRYDHNSTGTFGLIGQPDFTTIGNGQGFGVGWSALVPEWPTLSVNFSHGSGTGTLYGTTEETSSTNNTLNVHSTYQLAGFHINGYYDRMTLDAKYPIFLTGLPEDEVSNSTGSDFGANVMHDLPWNGSFSATFNHSQMSGDYGLSNSDLVNTTSYTTNSETANASFHPTNKWSLFANQSYIDNLSGYLYQGNFNSGGGVLPSELGTSSDSSTVGGGTSYQFTPNLMGQVQATYYHQSYFGNSYEGTYVSGSVNYGRKLFNMFTFSGTVIESSNGLGTNALGFIGNVNFYRNFGPWETSGTFSFAQNVQSILITYTTSYYSYNANLHRRFGRGTQWTAAMNGNHSGYTNQPGTVNHSEAFSTSLALRKLSFNANYAQAAGNSVLTNSGIQPVPPPPGVPPAYLILYSGTVYGGGLTLTPTSRLSLTGTYSHAVSQTLSNSILSNNRTEIFYSQLQYRFRRISLLGGYTQFSQGISAAGTPAGKDYSYFIGVQRWINFF